VQVTPLEGLLILKFISFEEKPERTKDMDDIHDILINYFEINDERFYNNLPDFMDEFSDINFQLEAGAWLAGYDIGKVLSHNQYLRNHILEIIQKEVIEDAGKISRYYYNKAYFDDIETIKRIFSLIIQGMNTCE
jgi:predicted nucleotidyltransferase